MQSPKNASWRWRPALSVLVAAAYCAATTADAYPDDALSADVMHSVTSFSLPALVPALAQRAQDFDFAASPEMQAVVTAMHQPLPAPPATTVANAPDAAVHTKRASASHKHRNFASGGHQNVPYAKAQGLSHLHHKMLASHTRAKPVVAQAEPAPVAKQEPIALASASGWLDSPENLKMAAAAAAPEIAANMSQREKGEAISAVIPAHTLVQNVASSTAGVAAKNPEPPKAAQVASVAPAPVVGWLDAPENLNTLAPAAGESTVSAAAVSNTPLIVTKADPLISAAAANDQPGADITVPVPIQLPQVPSTTSASSVTPVTASQQAAPVPLQPVPPAPAAGLIPLPQTVQSVPPITAPIPQATAIVAAPIAPATPPAPSQPVLSLINPALLPPTTPVNVPPAPKVAAVPVTPADLQQKFLPLPLTSNTTPDDTSKLSDQTKRIIKSLAPEIPPLGSKGSSEPIAVDHERANPLDQETEIKKHDGVGIQITVERPKMNVVRMLENAYDDLVAGDQQDAIDIYQQVLRVQPRNTLALFGLATTYHRAGQLELARPLYGKLLAIDPHNTEGLNNFLVLLADEAPQEALAELEKLQRSHPDFSPIPAQIALIQERLGDYKQAAETMAHAIDLSPANLKYRYDMAIILDKGGFYGQAADFYQQLVTAYLRGEKIPTKIEDIQERLTFIRSNTKQAM